jgi:hypothetical protein
MLVLDSADAAVFKQAEQANNRGTPAPSKPREKSLDWFNREDFLARSRRQKDAELPVDYDV